MNHTLKETEDDSQASLDSNLVEALRNFSETSRALIVTDFDGVLTPIISMPDQARPLPAVIHELGRLSGLPDTRVGILSSRTLADVQHLAFPPADVALVCSNGWEIEDRLGGLHTQADLSHSQAQLLRDLFDETEKISNNYPGTRVEARSISVVLHTLNADHLAEQAVMSETIAGPGAKRGITAVQGKGSVEFFVVPAQKVGAFRHLRRYVEPSSVLYVGDDSDDEAIYLLMDPRDGDVSVNVGSQHSPADYHVSSTEDVTKILGLVFDARSRRA